MISLVISYGSDLGRSVGATYGGNWARFRCGVEFMCSTCVNGKDRVLEGRQTLTTFLERLLPE